MADIELDLVIESPVSVGLAWLLAVDDDDAYAVRRFNRAWQDASVAAYHQLQQDGGYVAEPDGSPAPGALQIQPHVCAPATDGRRPLYLHTHQLIADRDEHGTAPIHREMVARAAPTVQAAASAALRRALDGLPMSKGCATAAGWELDKWRHEAERAERRRCPCPVAGVDQIAPLETYAQQLART